jgi:hypothetical protein
MTTHSSTTVGLCPKGDDPNTAHTGYFTLQVKTFVPRQRQARFRFSFLSESFSFDPSATSAVECEKSFQSLRNLRRVNCTLSTTYSNWGMDYVYTVQFREFPKFPFENNIWTHDGAPALSSFHCDTAGTPLYSRCDLQIQTDEDAVLPGAHRTSYNSGLLMCTNVHMLLYRI